MTDIQKARIADCEMIIYQDESPTNPREWDNLGEMICFHRRYQLGDAHDFTVEAIKEFVTRKEVISLPLYLLDHSGITMRTTPFASHWDSGQIGYIYATYEKIRKEFSLKRISRKTQDKIIEVLQGEVETFDQYLRGDIYGFAIYQITKCNLGHEHKEVIGSVGGYFGSNFKENGLFDNAGKEWENAEWEDA